MRNRRSALCAGVLLVAVGMMSGASALAYQGTSKGKKLAGQLLGSYKKVHYLSGSVHGSVYYCPGQVGGYFEGPGVPSACKNTSATVSWVNTLSNGKGVSAVGTVTANGKPTITFVSTSQGTLQQAKGASCWTKQGVNYSFVGYPPFGFFSNEYLTVGKKHNGNVDLIGTTPGGHFMETDTINAKTHQMVGESIYFGLKTSTPSTHLLTSYHQVSKAPKTPNTSPTC